MSMTRLPMIPGFEKRSGDSSSSSSTAVWLQATSGHRSPQIVTHFPEPNAGSTKLF